MKLLIIGAEGFIGQHVTASLASHDCYTADVTGRPSERHTLLTRESLPELVRRVQPDCCINCAGAAHVGQSFEDPSLDFDLNVELVRLLLEAIRRGSAHTRFVNMSSAAVYGNPTIVPVAETAGVAPISPYGWHKLSAEMLCREYHQCFALPTLSLRLFSVFGSGLRKQLYWDVFQRTRGTSLLTCGGTGEETRDYIHVTDVSRALATIVERANFDGDAINVAAGVSVSTRDAVTALLRAIHWDGELCFDGKVRVGDPLHWRADTGRLGDLGFQCQYDFQGGVEEVARWLTKLP